MPVDGAPATTVVLSPPPTPNGPLHVGHLAGPYIAADVAARAMRRHGANVIAVCGLDDHQNYVLARARQENMEVHRLREHYAGLIRQVFDRLGIGHDEFTEPAGDDVYRTAVAGFVDDLVGSGGFAVEQWAAPACPRCPGSLHHAYVTGECAHCGAGSAGGTCEQCGSFTSATVLVNPVCSRCGGAATATAQVRGPVLRMEEHRGALESFWCRAVLPGTVRDMIDRLRRGPLPTVPITYPTDWGIEYPALDGHRIDVWAEMGLGYLYTVGRRFAPTATGLAEHVAGWREVDALWAFLGLDNAYYYAVLLPAIYAAAGLCLDPLAGLVVNAFYQLDGAKFSTSRNHAVWAHELLERESPEDVRLFLCWDHPVPSATDFSLERFRRTIDAWCSSTGCEVTCTADLLRAEVALTPEHFDVALAARCLLAVPPETRGDLLAVLSGTRTARPPAATDPGSVSLFPGPARDRAGSPSVQRVGDLADHVDMNGARPLFGGLGGLLHGGGDHSPELLGLVGRLGLQCDDRTAQRGEDHGRDLGGGALDRHLVLAGEDLADDAGRTDENLGADHVLPGRGQCARVGQ
jgi:methionyl-tRNA synthetase